MPEKSVFETIDGEKRDLCAGQENMGWTLNFLYIIGCEEEKAEPKSYSLNFCILKVVVGGFFVVVVVGLLVWFIFSCFIVFTFGDWEVLFVVLIVL